MCLINEHVMSGLLLPILPLYLQIG